MQRMEPLEDFGEQLDQQRVERLREIVDPVCEAIRKGRWTRREALEAIAEARIEAACVIPDMMDQYDLIYETRFQRLLEQFPPRIQAVVLSL